MSWNDFEDLPPAEADSGAAPVGPVVFTFTGSGNGADTAAAVHEGTHVVLKVLQSWLAGDRAGVLIVQTRGAVGLAGEDVTDLAGAAVWGLVRSAQTENPGQVVLIDTDAEIDHDTLLGCWLRQNLNWWSAPELPTAPDSPPPRPRRRYQCPRWVGWRGVGVDYWWDGDGWGGDGPPCGGPLRGRSCGVGLSARPPAAAACGVGGRSSAAGASVQVLACDLAHRDAWWGRWPRYPHSFRCVR